MLKWTDIAWELKGTWVCNLNRFVEDTKLTCKTPASKINICNMIQNIIFYSTCLCVQSNFEYKRKTLQRLIFLFQNKRTSKKEKQKINTPNNFQGLKKKRQA